MRPLISYPADRRSTAIEKALYVMARAQAQSQHHSERGRVAQMIYADDKIVSQIVERGAAPLGTTTGSGFAAEISQSLIGDFIATLAPLSAAAQIIAGGLQVPMGTAKDMKLPAREGAPSTTVNWVGEGNPIPVASYTLNDNCELSPRKHGFIVAVSREAAKRAGGEAVIRQLIREDAAATLDGAYFSTAAGDSETHAGMLNGVSSIPGYGGGDRLAMETDLIAISDAITAGGSGQVSFVVSPKRAARIRIKAPDLSRELTFLPSLAVADTTIIGVDPLSWAHAFGDNFEIDATSEAILHMSDDPDPISDGGVADPVRSLWQTDAIALRMLADTAFAPRRPNAVAWVESASW